jgi:hypothetical protein
VQTLFPALGAPPESFDRAIVTRHGIVKDKSGTHRQMFLFFPTYLVGAGDQIARRRARLPLFPASMRRAGTNAASAHCVGG